MHDRLGFIVQADTASAYSHAAQAQQGMNTYHQRKGLTELVRTGAGARRISTGQLRLS